ncbi:flagellar biosynthetic protein FlhB [Azospirillum fermentarium]|uniref:flagellar biosynthesis protein FlhB n=1 Tax=Azospirillum fermentarium TaxID=1233114 RepID=UPI002226DAC0|nr:flagellar biosynthesis protein FlhB [Azospirillum fermentarium]MCW2246491.1 flagellar biosynthetic protein FlhB [Azospirillum fermentarium]
MSEDADESSKTEDATQKKLDEAHRQGNWPLSQEVPLSFIMVAALVILIALLPGMLRDLFSALNFYIERVSDLPMDAGNVGRIMLRVLRDMVWALWLPLLMLMIAGATGTIVQKGFTYSWELIIPKFEKLNPIAGIKRLLSPVPQTVELLKGIAKMAVVGGVAYLALQPMVLSVQHFIGIDLLQLLKEMDDLVKTLIIGVTSVVFIIAAADTFYQRYQYSKKMKMTKQEVKDEHKQSEGSPEVKSRIRQIRFERARSRMMSNVPTADVVVTNPTHFAVALKYDTQQMGAPFVVAKGVDSLALKIREVAAKNEVPVVENPPLARALYATVEVDEEIPAEHYRAVAELISYVYKLKKRSFN